MTIMQSMAYVVADYMLFMFVMIVITQIENRITERKGEK